MQHVREILRQKLALGRSHREVAKSLGVSPSTVASVFSDARSLGLDIAAVEALTDGWRRKAQGTRAYAPGRSRCRSCSRRSRRRRSHVLTIEQQVERAKIDFLRDREK
jgi:hypothetical protein